MILAKLENGNIKSSYEIVEGKALTTIFLDKWVSNPTVEDLLEFGYQELVHTEQPTIVAGQSIIETYTENENTIVVNYEIIGEPITDEYATIQ